MKCLVTGVKGQLGYDVADELNKRGYEMIGVDIEEMDITDAACVERVITSINPDCVIHCAAWTAVDMAEDDDKAEMVYKVNADGTRNIVAVCKKLDCKMVYVSTDYVFDGLGTKPWTPDCKDYCPLSVYGKSKLAGETAVSDLLDKYYIIRTAWLYGLNGNNFIKTMLRLSDKYDSIRVVNDQIGTPTYSADLSRLIVDMIETDKYGYYHATNEGGFISWADFAQEIFYQAQKATKVVPVSTEEYGLSKAKRPFNSRLDKSKLAQSGFTPLPDWKNALERYLKELDNDANNSST